MRKKRCPGPPWLSDRLKGRGYRCTISREIIMEILSHTLEHLSAEDIFLKIHKRYPQIGLTTVYRTLELLVDMDMVIKFDFGDGRARYELVDHPQGKGYHHHFVCTGCGRIMDYTDFINDELDLLKKTEEGLSLKYNFRIQGHLLQFYGLCADCCAKDNSKFF